MGPAVTRFPTRTIVLMALTLLSFAWMTWHSYRRAQRAAAPSSVQVIVLTDGGAP